MNERTIALFWSKVDRRGPDDCWPWLGNVNAKGYGMVVDGKRWIGTANSVALALHLGRPLFPGMQACHSCDTRYPKNSFEYRACVNPAHLWEGSNSQNQLDAHQKGRRKFKGEGSPRAKLSEEDVMSIRTHREKTNKEMARLFGVCEATISHIRTGRNWSHI